MAPRSRILQSPKYLRKKRKTIAWRIGFFVVAIVGIVAITICVLRLDPLRISDVKVTGNISVDAKDIMPLAESAISGDYSLYVPHNNIFVYPRAAIEKTILDKNPRLASAHAFRQKKTLAVEVTERLPSAIVCDYSSADCLFVDDKAFAFAEAPKISSKVYAEFDAPEQKEQLLSLTGRSRKIGETFMDPTLFNSLKNLSQSITKLGLTVDKIKLGVAGDANDVDFVTEDALGGQTEVFIRATEPFPTTLENLTLFLEKAKIDAKSKHTPVSFSSIDLRYGDSVFYIARDNSGNSNNSNNSNSSSNNSNSAKTSENQPQ